MDITKEREKRGWSKNELARRLGVTRETIRNWEQGKHKPSPMARRVMAIIFEKG